MAALDIGIVNRLEYVVRGSPERVNLESEESMRSLAFAKGRMLLDERQKLRWTIFSVRLRRNATF